MHGISILSSCVLIPRIIYSNDLLRAQNNQDSLFFHQLSFLYLIFRVFLYVHIKAIVSPLLCSNTCQTLLFSLKRLMTFSVALALMVEIVYQNFDKQFVPISYLLLIIAYLLK